MAREYKLKQRAERQDATRQRIVDATIELHRTVGSGATVSQIAERAGVGRVTVYRHFPDELALWRACSGHYLLQNPLPDPDTWSAIADPEERLQAALRETYAYHRANQAMFERALTEVRDHPIMEPYHDHWRRAAEVLVQPWPARGRSRAMLRAGIALALGFDTWRTLTREQGLSDDQAAELMLRLTCVRSRTHA